MNNQNEDKVLVYGLYKDDKKDNKQNFTIVESMVYEVVYPMKCLTLFSQLCPVSRKFKIDLKYISLTLEAGAYSFPPHFTQKISLYIHSPNNFPRIGKDTPIIQDIKKAYLTTIRYNQITTMLLDSHYDTDCYEYDLNYKFGNFNMKSDCIRECSDSYLAFTCNISGYTHTGSLLRKDLLEHNTNERKYMDNGKYQTTCINGKQYDVDIFCQQTCKTDCINRYYSTDLKQDEKPFYVGRGQMFEFKIEHNSFPDLLITYLPQTTFLSFVCNFGGLLGMWLGTLSYQHYQHGCFGCLSGSSKTFYPESIQFFYSKN